MKQSAGSEGREPPPVQAGADRRPYGMWLHCERLEDRRQLAAGVPAEPATAPPEWLDHGPIELRLVGDPAGLATPGRVTLPQAGFLDAILASLPAALPTASGTGDAQLVVRDTRGTLLATSVTGPGGVTLSQYLPAGTYDIALVAPQGVVGVCEIDATPAVPPGPIQTGGSPIDISIADVDRDGNADIVTAMMVPTSPDDIQTSSIVSVFHGLGGGRFAAGASYGMADDVQAMTVVDVSGDGLPDIVSVARGPASAVVILLATADGRFESARQLLLDGSAGYPIRLAVADSDVDGRADILVLCKQSDDPDLPPTGSVLIYHGDGRGGFSAAGMSSLPVGDQPTDLAIADVTGDGLPEILTSHAAGSAPSPRDGRPGDRIEVRALRGGIAAASGAYGSPFVVPMPGAVNRFALADMNHDGAIDIVAGMNVSGPGFTQIGSVAVALNRGGRSGIMAAFAMVPPIDAGASVDACRVGDVNGDGHPDVVITDGSTGVVTVLAGSGDGGLGTPEPHTVGRSPTAVALGDIDDDGRIDIMTADAASGTATILGQRDDGTFPVAGTAAVGVGPVVSASDDLDGDGRPDIVTVNSGSNDVSVLLGAGDGTFRPQRRFAVGNSPSAIVVTDMNGDGRIDLVIANAGDRSFTVLYGVGDGGFDRRIDTPVAVGGVPTAVAAADVDGDGWRDVVIATRGDDMPGTVTWCRGKPGGLAFTPVASRPAGFSPVTVTVADVDRDGRQDVVVANQGDGSEDHPGTVSIWSGAEGVAGWTFGATRTIAIGASVFGAAIGDLDGDAKPDLVVSMSRSDGSYVVTLVDDGTGGFARRRELPLTGFPTAPVLADTDGDARPDIVVGVDHLPSGVAGVVALAGSDDVASPRTILAGVLPSAVATTDVDADGRADLLITTALSPLVVALGLPDGSFARVGSGTFADRGADRVVRVPATGRFPGGTATLDRSGSIRVRVAGADDVATTPPGTGFDLAVVAGRSGLPRIATIDADRRGVSLYDVMPGGFLGPRRAIAVPSVDGRPALLSRIRAADVDADGNDDVIVSDPGTGHVRVLLAGTDGRFADATWQSLDAGAGVSQFVVADADGDGRIDIVAANQISGDVSVWLATPRPVVAAPAPVVLFGSERRFRASGRDAAFATDPLTGRSTIVAAAPIDDVAVADVDGDGRPDILATSAVARSYAVLSGLPGGGFSAPREHLPRAVATPQPVVSTRAAAPRELATGDFDGDGTTDVAMLDRDGEQVLVYLSSVRGSSPTRTAVESPVPGATAGPARRSASPGDRPTFTIPLAGNAPTSLLATDAGGFAGGHDGVLDLVVGNEYGDVLVLRGEADARGRPTGRFARSTRADGGVTLAATDIDGDGVTDFIYGDRSLDRVTVSAGASGTSFAADQAQGVIGPSAVATVPEEVAGVRRTNLVVANGAGNEVLLFLQNPVAGGDAFLAPRRFFVGTNPTALAVADVDGNGLPDVIVANGGSNDVSVLLGRTGDDGRWTLVAGPRLATGGSSPAGVAVADVVGLRGAAVADGIPDIVVTNRGSNSAALIAGIGAGFFADGSIRQLSLPAGAAPTAIFTVPRAGSSAFIVLNSGANSFSTFDSGRNFQRTDIGSGGVAPRAAAVYTQGGATSIAVGNLVSGNVAVFLASAGRLVFEPVDSRGFAGVSGLAFDAAGRLYGTAAGRDTALELYSFARPNAAPDASATALRALINFLPLGTGVGLVATLVTSAGIPVASAATGANVPLLDGERPAPTNTGEGKSLGAEGEARDPVAEDPAQRGVDVAESPALPLLRLFLDVEDSLRASNGRLLETLLSQAADPLDLLSAANLIVAAVARSQDAHIARAAAPPPAEPEHTSPTDGFTGASNGDPRAPDTQPISFTPPRQAGQVIPTDCGPTTGPVTGSQDRGAEVHEATIAEVSRRLAARFAAYDAARPSRPAVHPLPPDRRLLDQLLPETRHGPAASAWPLFFTPGGEAMRAAVGGGGGGVSASPITPRGIAMPHSPLESVDIALARTFTSADRTVATNQVVTAESPITWAGTLSRHVLDAAFAFVGTER